MKPGRWRKVDKVLQEVLDRRPEERDAYLEGTCGSDLSLRREVESLIASHRQAGTFMERPALKSSTVELTDQALQITKIDETIGICLDDRYQILAMLGEGGMGQVYLAVDRRLKRQVALKLLPASKIASEQLMQRFEQEARAASALNHPNIVTVHDIGQVDSFNYIVTEFIEGETLSQRLLTAKLTLVEVLDISIQVAGALVAAHQAGIVHRDIKPGNVIVRPDGLVKVIDFGIAKLVEQQASPAGKDRPLAPIDTEPGIVVGTPNYMSPEQARGLALDPRTDIFSLGVLLYQMITGHLPFDGATFSDVIVAILTNDPPPLATYVPVLPVEFEKIVSRALLKEREQRYQSATELLDDLRQLKYQLESKSPSRPATMSLDLCVAVSQADEYLHNLPTQPNPLIGRDTDIRVAEELLAKEHVRLLTLTGPGGIGKTRLALEVARNLLGEFRDGVFLVPLAAITESDLVTSEIADVIGVKETASHRLFDELKEYLRNKETLLVLDNVEQVLAAASSISELLTACHRLKIIVTSRVLLRLTNENEFGVPPLGSPALRRPSSIEELLQYPAVALFVERAQAARAGFSITLESANAIAEICNRLDGLPLAIELAAARVKLLSPGAMLDRLEHRLKLLTGGAKDLPLRQQTMRGAIAWSYDLLKEREQKLFRSLSVFPGGFSLPTAEAFCRKLSGVNSDAVDSDVLDGVSSLLDNSLIRTKGTREDEPRFGMMETIREFGLDCLANSGEAEATLNAHTQLFLELAERSEQELRGPMQARWLDRLEEDLDNFRQAMTRSKEIGNIGIALRLASSLLRFWEVRGRLSEARRWLEEPLALAVGAQVPSPLRAKALNAAGVLARNQADYGRGVDRVKEALRLFQQLGDKQGIACSLNTLGLIAYDQSAYDEAASLLQQALTFYRDLNDEYGIASCLNHLAILAQNRGDYQRATTFQEESVAIRRSLGDQLGLASSLNNLGVVALDHNDYRRAASLFQESLSLFRTIEDSLGIASSLTNLGEMAQYQGDYEQARLRYLEALDLFREVGDKREVATLLGNLGDVARCQGDYQRATALYAESLDLRHQVGEKASIAFSLEGLAHVARAELQMERAARLFGAAGALRESVGAPLPPARRSDCDWSLAAIRSLIGEEALSTALAEGRAMKLAQAVSFGITKHLSR
jgi:predicted ATPase/serine/threonine protein kinase